MGEENQKPLGIYIEGGDGVGKHVLSLGVLSRLDSLGYDVIYTNYPQYWLPTGTAIRMMNRKGNPISEYVASIGEDDPHREAELRCAMYSFDRAFTLPLIIAAMEELESPIVVSDRGPDSNHVTSAYMCLSGKIQPEEFGNFIQGYVPSFDSELRRVIDVHSILCMSEEGNEMASGGRASLDVLEASAGTQDLQSILYQLGEFPKVVTKYGGKWRETHVIAEEVTALFPQIAAGANPTRCSKSVALGPKLFMDTWGLVPTSEEKGVMDDWLNLNYEMQLHPQYKEKLDTYETLLAGAISEKLAKLTHEGKIDQSRYNTQAMYVLINRYPEIKHILRLYMGNEALKFFEAIIPGFAEIPESL